MAISSSWGMLRRLYQIMYPPAAAPVNDTSSKPTPIKFGILGAANIAPMSLISPASTHPEVLVYAVAARDRARAEAFAKKYSIPKVHADYQALLDDPDIEVVYNPLPNTLHYEWTIKALHAGKHVLLEKPSSNTAAETRVINGGYSFHPATQRLKAILVSNELGKVKSISTSMCLPGRVIFPKNDIRYSFDLGGGALMDMGCYTLNSMLYFASPVQNTSLEPMEVISASAIPHTEPNVDRRTTATLAFPNDITGTLTCDMDCAWRDVAIGAHVVCEGGEVDMWTPFGPAIHHTITVTKGKTKRVEKAYVPGYTDGVRGVGEEWWTTYRYQLETFVDRLKGRKVGPEMPWISERESVANIAWIEKIYEKTGLGSRPESGYKAPL